MIEFSRACQQYIGSDQNKLRAGVEVTKIRHLIQGEIPDGCLFFDACFVLTIYLNKKQKKQNAKKEKQKKSKFFGKA